MEASVITEYKAKTNDGKEFTISGKVAEISTFFKKSYAEVSIDKIDGPTMEFLIKHLEAHDYDPPACEDKRYPENALSWKDKPIRTGF